METNEPCGSFTFFQETISGSQSSERKQIQLDFTEFEEIEFQKVKAAGRPQRILIEERRTTTTTTTHTHQNKQNEMSIQGSPGLLTICTCIG